MNIKAPVLFFVGMSLLALNTSSFAKDYYKWVDAQGSTHYTTTPPPKAKGIKERGKIQTYGATNNSATHVVTPNNNAEAKSQAPVVNKTTTPRQEQPHVMAEHSASEPASR